MTTRHVDIADAAEQFADLIDAAARGTDIVIEQNGRAIVRMRSALGEEPGHVTKNPDNGVDLGPPRDR